jgi:uncharacterized membrane protein YgcG
LENLKTLRRIFHSFDGKEIDISVYGGSNSTEVKCYASYDGKDTLYFNNCEDESYNGYIKVGLSENGTLSITDDDNFTYNYESANSEEIRVGWIENGTTYQANIHLPNESEGESESGSNSGGVSEGSGSHSGGGS